MHFDDRLATVLRHRASGERAARTQFRQLLDLLGNKRKLRDGARDESLLAAAWLRLGALGESIPAGDRAAMIREPGFRFRSAALAAHLAEDEPDVAAAALSRADLSVDDWEALIPRLPIRARGFLRLRRDLPPPVTDLLERLGVHDRGLPRPDQTSAVADAEIAAPAIAPTPVRAPTGKVQSEKAPSPKPPSPKPPPQPANDVPGTIIDEDETEIGALVKRIEAYQKARSSPSETADSPRLPLGESADREGALPSGFAFTADARGRIDWADRSVAPAVVGTVLNHAMVGSALKFHQPVRQRIVTLQGSPILAGEWIMDAQPRFARQNGRFYGYAGMFRRADMSALMAEEEASSSEADRLRQLLHELRTPVNAIQGFSEVIQQQLFGPTPHEYRALAAGIAGDSARMLAGFDELDRLARLETGAMDLEMGECDFSQIVSRQITQLQSVLKPRTATFDFTQVAVPMIGLDGPEAEALAWRLLATLAGTIGAGEAIRIDLAEHDGAVRLSCGLPATLASETDIFAASAKPASGIVSAGMFGAGFSLRLARAEAQAAGGELTRVDDWLLLALPPLTQYDRETSQTGSESAA